MRLAVDVSHMTYIEIGAWPLMQIAAQAVRTAVFVQEQGIAPEDEWDADDVTALHAVLFDVNGQPLGNARLLQPLANVVKVGRMAVLRDVRGHGYGARLLQALLREARRQGHKQVRLSAQRTAEGFYAAHGFTVAGEPFDEVGIPHVEMRLDLNEKINSIQMRKKS
jgi:predicted GNAT family N-acyltransferase